MKLYCMATAHESKIPRGGSENKSNISQDDRVDMEQALGDSGYDPGPVDGVIDNQTREAVRVFQEDHSLVATGIVDPATGELLAVVISQPSQPDANFS